MAATGTAKFTFTASGVTIDGEVELPDRAATVEEMLPVLHGVGGALVQIAANSAMAHGAQISCRAGCGACCRQLVPLSEHEARTISDMVFAMEEPRRTTTLLRFREAIRRVEESGLRPKIENLHLLPNRDEITRVGLEYFKLGVPCPFLEDESCGIHPVRPMICREYLVVSDPEHCRHPEEGKTVGVILPGKPSQALAGFGIGDGTGPHMMIPLILSLQFAAANPAPPPTMHASEILHSYLKSLQGEINSGEEQEQSEERAEG